MSLEITGKLIKKYDVQEVPTRSSNVFRKREFVVELTEEINGNNYTNYAKMQLVQAKCDIINSFNEGDNVKVSRYEKDGKTGYITNLDAWRVEHSNNAPAAGNQNNNNNNFNQNNNQGNYNQGPNPQGGFNQGGNAGNFNAGGYNQGNFNQPGYNQGNFNQGNSTATEPADDLPF
jgi:Domain of unknown function (DUF3127)